MTIEPKLFAAMAKRLIQAEQAILALAKKAPKSYVINKKVGGIKSAVIEGDYLIVTTLDDMRINAGNVRGMVGPQGERGRSGFSVIGNKGPRGEPGLQGNQGEQGIGGPAGQDGKDGVSITDVWVTIKNDLIIKLSDGREINVGQLPAPVYTGGGSTETSAGGVTEAEMNAAIAAAIASAAPHYEPANAHILKDNATATLTAGYSATPADKSAITTGTFTPTPADGGLQKITNNGSHTLAPPASSCTINVLYTNGSSAGTVTTSGFSKVTGDSFDTTNTHVFMCYIVVNGAKSHLHIQAMQ